MGTVKTVSELCAASMQEKTRFTIGYAALGLTIGLFVFPWLYIPLVRRGVAVAQNPLWIWFFFALVLLPAVLMGMMGSRRAREQAA